MEREEFQKGREREPCRERQKRKIAMGHRAARQELKSRDRKPDRAHWRKKWPGGGKHTTTTCDRLQG